LRVFGILLAVRFSPFNFSTKQKAIAPLTFNTRITPKAFKIGGFRGVSPRIGKFRGHYFCKGLANFRLVQSPNPKRIVLPITGRASVSQGTATTELGTLLMASLLFNATPLRVPAVDVIIAVIENSQ
jgi:hypothetical protein